MFFWVVAFFLVFFDCEYYILRVKAYITEHDEYSFVVRTDNGHHVRIKGTTYVCMCVYF